MECYCDLHPCNRRSHRYSIASCKRTWIQSIKRTNRLGQCVKNFEATLVQTMALINLQIKKGLHVIGGGNLALPVVNVSPLSRQFREFHSDLDRK